MAAVAAEAAGTADTVGSHTVLAVAAVVVEHTDDMLEAVVVAAAVEEEEGLGAVRLVPALVGGMLPSVTIEPMLELGWLGVALVGPEAPEGWRRQPAEAVSYTHLTLPTKRIV